MEPATNGKTMKHKIRQCCLKRQCCVYDNFVGVEIWNQICKYKFSFVVLCFGTQNLDQNSESLWLMRELRMMDMAYEQASEINDTRIWQFWLLSGHQGCLCCCSMRFGK
jgi:hypothetical protein